MWGNDYEMVMCFVFHQIIPFSSRYDVKVLHTPGHTPESVVYILVDKQTDNTPLKVS